MIVNITPKKETSQVEMEISVPAEEFQPFINKAAKKLSKDVSLKGFRPGKAPLDVVVEHVGQEHVLREAMDAALPKYFVDAAVEHKVDAINRPNITVKQLGLEGPFEFTAIVDVLPEVTLGDPTKVSVEKKEITVGDKEIEQELGYLAKMRGQDLEVARPAQEGDTVNVDFTVKIDGAVIEGGESKNHPVTLGEGRFIPDFEKNITGMTAGDTRDFSMTFPDNYPQAELQGKTADVTVKAHAVQKRVLPEINDEFAKGLGEFKDLEELKDKLKENMKKELSQKEEDRYLGELAEKYAEVSTFGHIPEVLIEKEIDNRIEEFASMLAYQQKNLDEYLARENKTLDQMRADMRPTAEKRVKVGLTLRRFAEKEGITVEEKEVTEEATAYLSQYKDPEQAAKELDAEHLRDHIESVIRNRKTLKKLSELATKPA
ncbi:MAG: trigger factor [Candidatus Andersenbacteria bacterium]